MNTVKSRLIAELTCLHCLKILREPMKLTCGDSICKEHLEANVTSFVCKSCKKEIHLGDGYEALKGNTIVQNLIEKQVYLTEDELQLKKSLEESIEMFYQLNRKFRDSKDREELPIKFHEHFQEMRRQIDLQREELKDKIDKIALSMIDQVKKFESTYALSFIKKADCVLSQFEEKNLVKEKAELCEKFRETNLLIGSINELKAKQDKSICDISFRLYEITEIKKQLETNQFKRFEFDTDNFGLLNLNSYTTPEIFPKSEILNEDLSFALMKLCEFKCDDNWTLSYRASRDGFGANTFHSECDNHPQTLTIIKVNNSSIRDDGVSNIFGGYASVAMDSTYSYYGEQIPDSNAFIFSLVNKDNKPCKMNIDSACIQNAHYNRTDSGPIFGQNNNADIFITSYPNEYNNSFSDLGLCYKHPVYEYGTNEAKTFLAGSYNFQISEIEVYKKT
jgi:hypothetical protein